MDESAKDRLLVGSAFATQPTKRSASSASLDRGLSKRAMKESSSSEVFLHPITRTPSAHFPVTRTPSRQGLAMIKTTESSPPPTQLEFEEALQLLHKLEKRLRSEVEMDLKDLRRQMTAKKIEYVSSKAQRLYTIRQQLGTCRYLCKQEEEVMGEFDKVKVLLEQQSTIDEDSYARTKVECLVLGGKLTDIRRRQRRLSGQVEELEMTIREIFNKPMDDLDDEEFDLEAFKRKPLADEPRLAPTMSSYPLFNNAPFSQGPPIKITTSYSSDSLGGFGVSDDGASEIPDNPSPVPPSLVDESDPNYMNYYRYRDTTDVSQDEREEAYYPQAASGAKRRKKKRSDFVPRNRTSSMSSDTDAEDLWTAGDEVSTAGSRMSADEAKRIAENKQKLIEEERRREEAEQQRIRDEMEWKSKAEAEEKQKEKLRLEAEMAARKQEEEARKKVEEEKKKAELEAKRIAAEEKKKAELEAKRIAAEEKKKAELEAKRIAAEEKKKAEAEAKRIADEEKKAELEAKKLAAEEKKKAELETKRIAAEEKKRAEVEAKRIAEEEKAKAEIFARQQAEEEASRKRTIEAESMALEQSNVEEGAIEDLQMPLKKGRSASRDRKAASKAVSDPDDMIYDEEHQISTKEDLFAMIGDTSLKSGRAKRESEKDLGGGGGRRSKKNSGSDMGEDLELGQHPRPGSRLSGTSDGKPSFSLKHQSGDYEPEVYSSSESMVELPDATYTLSTSRPLSRRSSQDRPLGVEGKLQKSRTASRERPGLEVGDDEGTSFGENSAGAYQRPQSRVRSRTSSKDAKEADFEFERQEDIEVRPQSRLNKPGSSRSGSRMGMADQPDPMDDVDEDTSSGPGRRDKSISRPGSRAQKSRNASKERPQSREEFGDPETPFQDNLEDDLPESAQIFTQERGPESRPGSRSQKSRNASGELAGVSQDEPDVKRPASRTLKSRTSSGDRKAQVGVQYDQEFEENQDFDEPRPASRKSFQDPRPASRNSVEGSGNFEPDLRNRPQSRQSKPQSRTSSNERKNLASEDYEQRPKSRNNTYSQEEDDMMNPDEEDFKLHTGGYSESRPKSRISLEDADMDMDLEYDTQDQESFHAHAGRGQDPHHQKSRTSSGDRGSSQQGYEAAGNFEPDLRNRPQSRQSKPQSRTSSNERKNIGFEDYEQRPKSRNNTYSQEDDDMMNQDEEDFRVQSGRFSEARPKSRNSLEGPDNNLNLEYEYLDPDSHQERPRRGQDSHQQKSRTSSRDRHPTHLGYDDHQLQDEFDPANEFSDEDFDTEISQIERKNVKSRTHSSERPDLDLDPPLKPKSRTQSRERPESRSNANRGRGHSRTSSGDRNEVSHFTAGDNQDIYAHIKDRRDLLAHSRTTSEDHPGSLGYEEEYDDEDVPGLEAASKEGSEMELGLSFVKDPNKSRTSSRERPKTLNLRSREEMESGRDFTRSRTSSNDRMMRKMDPETDSMDFELASEFPKSHSTGQMDEHFLGVGNQRSSKSRTASRERPNNANERSRTHSRERPQTDADQGYNTMGGRLRRYRDEEALDIAAEDAMEAKNDLLGYNTLDSGIEDYTQFYQDGDYDTPATGYDQEAPNEEDQQNRGRTKKVSFAESDEKFVLRPEPEVLVIPGTKLFTFAPSSTHEQPPEEELLPLPAMQVNGAGKTVQTNGAGKIVSHILPPVEKDTLLPVVPKPTQRQSPLKDQKSMSTSPKAFLKAMLSSMKPTADRKGLLDTLLKKGKSVSLQGSRSSSRQGSVDRGATSEKGFSQSFDYGRTTNQQSALGYVQVGSSKATDSSLGSVELNLDQETSDLESDYSFLKRSGNKKKKPPKVKSVDFDQLFARGHAIEELREKQSQNLLTPMDPRGAQLPAQSDGFFPTPFEVYSKDEAFKRAQQGAGISYEEKVQSYLHDQQHQQGLNSQMFEEFNAETGLSQNGSHESRKAERKLKRDRSRSDSNKRVQDVSLERKKEQQQKVGYAKPEDIRIEQSVEPVLNAEPPPLPRPGSRMSLGRPADPEEFLFNIQEFVRRAEVDQEYSQPVWPAIVQSPNELPPMRTHARTNSMTVQNRHPEGEGDQNDGATPMKPNEPCYNLQMFNIYTEGEEKKNVEERPTSPYQLQRSGNTFQERVAPSPGKSYLEMKPSTVPDPFQYKIDPSEALMVGPMDDTLVPPPVPSPRRGRSPRQQAAQLAGDAHIPAMLKPDPLTAHELMPPPIIPSTLQSTQQLRLADGGDEGLQQTIRDTDLYKRLQEGLKNIDKILASERFQERIRAAGLEHQKYSHHLGRAEFGVLKKRSGSSACVTTTESVQTPMSGPIQKSASAAAISGIFGKGNLPTQRAGSTQSTALPSRDSSGERPASAMALTGKYQPITTRGRTSNLSSRQGSRDSSLGRPDSRMSNYSAMPDLEPGYNAASQALSGLSDSNQHHDAVRVINIEPHPEIFEKKRELMQQLALEKMAVREAKVWAEVFLLFVVCFCALVYLQSEG